MSLFDIVKIGVLVSDSCSFRSPPSYFEVSGRTGGADHPLELPFRYDHSKGRNTRIILKLNTMILCLNIKLKIGPAFAAGCPVIIKPSEETPLSALALCAIAKEAGIPSGVMNCLTVSREDTVDVGREMCHHHDIRKVSFTGSTAVGKWLMKESSSTVKRVTVFLFLFFNLLFILLV
jgi:hypothetical protein